MACRARWGERCGGGLGSQELVGGSPEDFDLLHIPLIGVWTVLVITQRSVRAAPKTARSEPLTPHTTVLEGGATRGSLEETDHVYSLRNRSLDCQHWTAGTLLGRWNLLPEQFKK